ncbi:carbohydrate ABC transporter permease [Agromyces italicus]|uniref:carbohydrate ABC transporter permease n=1 Tax=Agromyces italicus TaxID=279572 RepID=UPI0003B31AFE|nr:carbohydrate ABC transporter permease [Agromyces italicus]
MRNSGERRRRKTPNVATGISAVVLIGFVLIALLPFLFMAVTSIQRTTMITVVFDPAKFTLDNYVRVFADGGFGMALLTSVIVVTLACLVNAIVCSLAAYAFAKKPFPGSEVLFWVYIATMMVPGQVTLIPLFTMMRELGLLNSYLSLFLPIINAFGVFLIRQFMETIPDEMIEAARIDGATEMQIFSRIILPSIRPAIIALTVFTFLTTWNDFLWPLVSITNEEMQTVTLAVANLQGRYLTDFGLVMAGATVSFLVPLVMYLILQRQFVEGITSSSVKG